MLWIDFGIICIGQEEPSVPSDIKDIVVESSRRTAGSEPLYDPSYDNFPTADGLTGCWHRVWLPNPVCYEESFFDISPKDIPWVSVAPKRADAVRRILSFYLNESPVHRIAVLLRVQDTSGDVVHPDCRLDDFIHLLTAGEARWNELYFVCR